MTRCLSDSLELISKFARCSVISNKAETKDDPWYGPEFTIKLHDVKFSVVSEEIFDV